MHNIDKLCMTLSLTSTFFYILYNTFHILQFKKKSLLTGVYGHVGHHILHEKEKNRKRNTTLAYDPKEDGILLYFLLYVRHLEE